LKMQTQYEARWEKSGVAGRYIPVIRERLDKIVHEIRKYDLEGDSSDQRDFEAGLESLAYTTTEQLAQLCAGGQNWIGSDKTRFLSPTVDFVAIVKQHAKVRHSYDIVGKFLELVRRGSEDFLQVAKRSQSWFEALNFTNEEVRYLLWAAHKAMRLLGVDERIPGFTPLALTSDQVLDSFRKCESPIESVLYMQLVVEDLLPPALKVQWETSWDRRLDMAIPEGKIAIECEDHDDKVADTSGDEVLRKNGWIVLRFSTGEILDSPAGCAHRIHSEYPWKNLSSSAIELRSTRLTVPDEPKQWQASIWVGEMADQPVIVFGESLAKLRAAASDWLRENKPSFFSNASPEHDETKRPIERFYYSYWDGTNVRIGSEEAWYEPIPVEPEVESEDWLSELPKERKLRSEGWYLIRPAGEYSTPEPESFEDFDSMISHFVELAMIPEKGPDYQEVAIMGGELQLHLIKTVWHEGIESYVNDLLQRGWHIIALEYEGRTDERGMLSNRQVVFVLGHPEENASRRPESRSRYRSQYDRYILH
jgi:very-short-patch-repair endonuclease